MSEDTRRLIRCLTFIKENTTQVEKILDRLIEDEIIGLDERATILIDPRPDNQLHVIIETVIKKQAHKSFLDALKNTGNNHVLDKITEHCPGKDRKKMDREKTYTVSIESGNEPDEKAQREQFIKEKTLEELKLENDRLKNQQSKIRENLNEKHKKIQELRKEISNYKRQNTELTEKLKSYEEIELRMQDIEEELRNKEKMNKIIEMALSDRSEEIFRLQTECEGLKQQNEEKTEQISHLTMQMEALKDELQKASTDRKKLEEKFVEMSNSMTEKFSDMMDVLEDLKGHRVAQSEVLSPRASRQNFHRRTNPPNFMRQRSNAGQKGTKR